MQSNNHFLPGVPIEKVRSAYDHAAGNEIESGKFWSPESSSALAANTFGWFLERPKALPRLPVSLIASPVKEVRLEAEMRFPWAGGKHPWLDAVLVTDDLLIGIESKRYEPFRGGKKGLGFTDAYDRPVWGDSMARYCAVRDELKSGALCYEALDAAQLVKHAYGLRSAVHRENGPWHGLRPVLFYLYAEPVSWPGGRPVDALKKAKHRSMIDNFAGRVAGDEVAFIALDYASLVASWAQAADAHLAAHATNLAAEFDIGPR
ncbi:hypothetical protein OEW28_17255 [Defluviimonas sp. WL0002]|uniref:Restriction endonuclease n=1 Tax=Albidovulum marisflavi TaxID=2984159 RepID=A0ABT2ZGW5_9RHOB|nr:hypothetical protein [Defluviimonas sp. WL0002]MCV2870365.1 hypothetical protein [Defluviimonas sp. WL0002]